MHYRRTILIGNEIISHSHKTDTKMNLLTDIKKALIAKSLCLYGGEHRIRTYGPFPVNGFKVRNRPLTVNEIKDLTGHKQPFLTVNVHKTDTIYPPDSPPSFQQLTPL